MATGIVGSKGFIGSHLTRYLADGRSVDLRLLVRNSAGSHCPASAEMVHGDLLSRPDCERFAKDLKVIYYLAHNNTPVDSDLDWPSDALANLIPLLNLLHAIEHLGTRPHVVYFSSGGAIYAPKSDRIPYRETDLRGPSSSYGIQKLAAEEYLRLAARKGHLTATVLRVGNAYGALLSQYRLQGLIGVAINCVAHAQPVRIFGNPRNVRDYIHLDDIGEIAARASAPQRDFNIVNVGSGVGHSVMEVLHAIEECVGKPIDIRADRGYGDWLTDWVVLDNAKAREEFGWSPAIDLRTGVSRLVTGK